MSFVMTTYGAISTGAIQIVTPETLPGVGGQALNDNFKRIRDAVYSLETSRSGYGDIVTHNVAEFATISAVGGMLQSSLNLSDLNSPATARTNLGVGTIATHAAGDFTLVANNLSELTATAATARTNLGLGTISTHAEADYLLAANNLSDLGDAPTARTNLGLGDSSTHPAADFLLAANNLSDIADAPTALTNLGIGGGWSGTFATGDSRTATVTDGIITGVS